MPPQRRHCADFSGAGATAKTITVHTTTATMLKRYAPASVRFDAAQPAPIDAIHAGDQLRARGAKNAEGTEIAAEEVVSGSFRNISGTIASRCGQLDAGRSRIWRQRSRSPSTSQRTRRCGGCRIAWRMMLAARLKGRPTGGAARSTQHGGAFIPRAAAETGKSRQRSLGHGASNGRLRAETRNKC
jgi:hypothetical protein